MYKLHVRSHTDYCISVWNPQYKGDITKMEKVQNKMSRLLVNGERMSHDERNCLLHISSHEERRAPGYLINTFKKLDNLKYFTMRSNLSPRDNTKTITRRPYNSDVKRHSFKTRVVRDWNALPEDVVNSECLRSSKYNLDEFLRM